MHVVCCIQFVQQCFLNIKVFDKLMKDAQYIKCRMLFNSAKTWCKYINIFQYRIHVAHFFSNLKALRFQLAKYLITCNLTIPYSDSVNARCITIFIILANCKSLSIKCVLTCNFSFFLQTVMKCWHCDEN